MILGHYSRDGQYFLWGGSVKMRITCHGNTGQRFRFSLATAMAAMTCVCVVLAIGVATVNVISSVRRSIVMQLREAIPRDLSKQEPSVRRMFAREVLRTLVANVPRDKIYEALADDLRSDDLTVRENAAIILGELSPTDGSVVQALLIAMDDRDEKVRVAAEESLVLLVESDLRCREMIESCAHSGSSAVAQSATRVVVKSRRVGQSRISRQ